MVGTDADARTLAGVDRRRAADAARRQPDWFDVSLHPADRPAHRLSAGDAGAAADRAAVSQGRPRRVAAAAGRAHRHRARRVRRGARADPGALDAFNKAERDVAATTAIRSRAAARAKGATPDIEAVYAVGDHPRIYYVEASRRYRTLGQAPTSARRSRSAPAGSCATATRSRSLSTVVDLLALRSRRRQLHAAARRDARWRTSCSGWRSSPAGTTSATRDRDQTEDRRGGRSTSGVDRVRGRSEKSEVGKWMRGRLVTVALAASP